MSSLERFTRQQNQETKRPGLRTWEHVFDLADTMLRSVRFYGDTAETPEGEWATTDYLKYTKSMLAYTPLDEKRETGTLAKFALRKSLATLEPQLTHDGSLDFQSRVNRCREYLTDWRAVIKPVDQLYTSADIPRKTLSSQFFRLLELCQQDQQVYRPHFLNERVGIDVSPCLIGVAGKLMQMSWLPNKFWPPPIRFTLDSTKSSLFKQRTVDAVFISEVHRKQHTISEIKDMVEVTSNGKASLRLYQDANKRGIQLLRTKITMTMRRY